MRSIVRFLVVSVLFTLGLGLALASSWHLLSYWASRGLDANGVWHYTRWSTIAGSLALLAGGLSLMRFALVRHLHHRAEMPFGWDSRTEWNM